MFRNLDLRTPSLLSLTTALSVCLGCGSDPQKAVESNYVKAVESYLEDSYLCLTQDNPLFSGKLSGEPFTEQAASRWPMWDELVAAGMFEKEGLTQSLTYRKSIMESQPDLQLPVRAFRYSISEGFKKFIHNRARADFFQTSRICVTKMKLKNLLSVDGPRTLPPGVSTVVVRYEVEPDELPEEILAARETFKKFFPKLFDDTNKRTAEVALILTHHGWKARQLAPLSEIVIKEPAK
jgi:hypothetical protein